MNDRECRRPGSTGQHTSKEISIRDDLSAEAEFGRWRDVQRMFGIKRGTLYRLISERKIRSITLREPGRKFGCRLIHLQSVRDYLHSLMADQEATEASE